MRSYDFRIVDDRDAVVSMVSGALSYLSVTDREVNVVCRLTEEDPEDYADVDVDHHCFVKMRFFQQRGKPFTERAMRYLVVHECLHVLMVEGVDGIDAAISPEQEESAEAIGECYITKMAWALVDKVFLF
jgi:hypothetical protein